MNQIGGAKKRKIQHSSGHQRNNRLGKSQAHPLGVKSMLPHNPLTDSRAFDDVDDQNQSKKFDEFQTIQTPGTVQNKNAKGLKQVQIVSDFNASIKS